MAKKSRQSFLKRAKEKTRQERKGEKEARKAAARERKASLPPRDDEGEADPDIAGIVPGPQPLPPQFDD